MIRQQVMELLAIGAVLGGRRDMAEDLAGLCTHKELVPLADALARSLKSTDSDAIYEWFRERLGVELDRSVKVADALVAEMRRRAELRATAAAGFSAWRELIDTSGTQRG